MKASVINEPNCSNLTYVSVFSLFVDNDNFHSLVESKKKEMFVRRKYEQRDIFEYFAYDKNCALIEKSPQGDRKMVTVTMEEDLNSGFLDNLKQKVNRIIKSIETYCSVEYRKPENISYIQSKPKSTIQTLHADFASFGKFTFQFAPSNTMAEMISEHNLIFYLI